MKKFAVWLSAGILALSMAGCADPVEPGDVSSQEEQAEPGGVPSQEEQTESGDIPSQEDQTESGKDPSQDGETSDHDYSQGWTDEMNAIKKAITDELGDNYFPNTPMDPDYMEDVLGITGDMYDDYLAEMPAINTNADMLIIVRAGKDQADTVEALLNAYRDKNVGDTMQYPQNIGKIQASRVARIDNYVIYVQLGGDIMDAMDEGDEAVIVRCQEENDKVIGIIEGMVR